MWWWWEQRIALATTAAAAAAVKAVAVAAAETAVAAVIAMFMAEGKTRGRGDQREELGVPSNRRNEFRVPRVQQATIWHKLKQCF
jgi:hypothetical protein